MPEVIEGYEIAYAKATEYLPGMGLSLFFAFTTFILCSKSFSFIFIKAKIKKKTKQNKKDQTN